MPDLPAAQGAMDLISQAPRGLTAVLGLAVMLAGARLYPLVIIAPGLVLGVAGALLLPFPIEPASRAILAVVLAGAGALVCRALERFAIWGIGAVVSGTLVMWLWPLVRADAAPPWLAAVGAVFGLLLFPRLFQFALKPITAALGAMIILWSMGWQDRPLVFGGLLTLGLVVQFATGKKGRDKQDDD